MQVQSRFSESNFRRFSATIAAAINAFPNAISIDPRPLSVETYAARCRDAIRGKVAHGWQDSRIDAVKFDKFHSELVVSMQDDKVIIGPKAAIRTKKAVGQVLETRLKQASVVVLPEYLSDVCRLIHNKALNPLPPFIVITPDLAMLQRLEASLDVAFVPTGTENQYSII